MRNVNIKCHHCDKTLEFSGMDALISCSCGYQYLLRDYMCSFRTNNLPSGAATAIFNAFIENWPQVKGYAEKMRLIDRLIHEFHINLNSGVQGRFVGINLIEGSKKQIGELINDLAYATQANEHTLVNNQNSSLLLLTEYGKMMIKRFF